MLRTFLSCVPPLVVAAAAAAQAPDPRALAAGCASCHRPEASAIPSLQGRPREKLRAALRGFRDGSRGGTVMPQLARGYTEAQLDAIAAWYSMQRAGAR